MGILHYPRPLDYYEMIARRLSRELPQDRLVASALSACRAGENALRSWSLFIIATRLHLIDEKVRAEILREAQRIYGGE